MSVVAQVKPQVELWKNTAAGMRWFVTFDGLGKEQGRTVNGNRTFTITPFERRINQERAALSTLDPFRNGTFLLVEPADDTDMDEISDTQARTDGEIQQLINDLKGDPTLVEEFLQDIESPITLNRLLEDVVIDGSLPKTVIDAIKDKIGLSHPTKVVDREIVSTIPDPPADKEWEQAGKKKGRTGQKLR